MIAVARAIVRRRDRDKHYNRSASLSLCSLSFLLCETAIDQLADQLQKFLLSADVLVCVAANNKKELKQK